MVLIKFIHLLSLVVWLGGMIFFSFIAAPSIFKMLPRETAGDVVGNIFPKYWMLGYICSITALATLLILSFQEKAYPWARIGLLVLMTALVFYSGKVIGKNATEVKAQIRATEDQAQKESLRLKFKAIHRKSMILNAVILILGMTVLFLTAYALRYSER
ncbi:MAG: DUF4149 domain-containing protein [Deltaproteobacteria bacterium]|nr:DUF4149 domain-containing protein [Deltaproteobacteria bacterium]MBI3753303.1 DUF4149 domain-containing protein [Deltaproteobacteria bacterium]